MNNKWSEDEVIIAYSLYCVTPLNKINPRNEHIKAIANLAIFNHSVDSLVLRMRNFQSLDPGVKGGLRNIAKLDKKVFEKFNTDWGELATVFESITGFEIFDLPLLQGSKKLSSVVNKNKTNRLRAEFKKYVFATYEDKCAISGVSNSALLRASHIKPFSACKSNNDKVAATNGILLNAFYDACFDKGYFTIDKNYKIIVSKHINDNSQFISDNLKRLANTYISIPSRNRARYDFIEYHNDIIFKR